ncbi:MAG: ATP-binding protein [Campylobacterota bacterium]|nr:ATP-binding protein [Campylobacterota bacterium]
MSNDGLKKIYLIKSAGYEFNEVQIDENTLLLGESGVGKTTIMRAVLFFYTMDYSDSMLNLTSDTKKSFNDWYFREHNSHLVYEYTKGDSKFLFVVSKSGKLHYSFIDITNYPLGVKELFIDESRPVTLEKLNEKVQKAHLSNYHTSIKERYINTFHKKDANLKKIKQESLVDFSLFESIKFTLEYAKTLSNIFMASKVNSSSIKKSIVSLIDNSEAKIDLSEIRINLDEYVKHKDEIEKFEKKVPRIEELSVKYDKYHNNRVEFKQKANELEATNAQISQKMQDVMLKIGRVQEANNALKKNYDVEASKLQEKIESSNREVIEQNKELKELEKKSKEYLSLDIEKLVGEYNQESNYRSELKINQEEYDALTAKFETIKEKYKKIEESLVKASGEKILELKNESVEFHKSINSKKAELVESKESQTEEQTQKYVEEKLELGRDLKNTNDSFNATNVKIGEIKYFIFNKEEISKYEESIGKYEKALVETQKELNENGFKIEKIEHQIEEIAKELEASAAKLNIETESKKAELFKEKSLVEDRLDIDRDNLYGYINRNNIKNAKKLVTYLKDEILFSQIPFRVEESGENSSIFGLNITFEEEFQNAYDRSKLLKELKLIKESIKKLNRDSLKKSTVLNDEASSATKEKNRQRTILHKEKVKLDENRKSYEKNRAFSELSLQKAKEDADELKKHESTKLQKALSIDKLKLAELNENIIKISQKIEEISQSIKEDIAKHIAKLNRELQENESELTSKIETLKDECTHNIESNQNKLNEVLKNSGANSQLIEDISNKMKKLELMLQDIEKNRPTVIVYLAEYKERLKTIPSLEKKLKDDREFLDGLREKEVQINKEYRAKESELKDQKEILDTQKVDIEKFIATYAEKIEGQEISRAIKNSLNLNNYNLDNTLLAKPSMIDFIITLFEEIKQAQDSIASSVIKILKELNDDNIFKINIPSDNIDDNSYLKTAKELIEYIKNDKLTLIKDVSLDKFKSNIVLIKKQLSNFEDGLIDIKSEVNSLRNSIRKAVDSFRVIDNINIRFEDANSSVLNALSELSEFYDNNSSSFLSGLFESLDVNRSSQRLKEELGEKIVELVALLNVSKEYLYLEEGFVLEFKVVERGNDLSWRQTLNDIGSNGTSTLVKSIINISMLKMVSKNIVKDSPIVTHCILDEIGTISTDYFKELKEFVNSSGFVFLNGMPTEDDMLMSMYPAIYIGQNFGDYSKMILASKVSI